MRCSAPRRTRRAIELPGTGPVSFPGRGVCFEAQAELFGDILTWARVTYVPEELNNKLTGLVTSAPAYTQTMQRWSGCMARRGYHYAFPAKAKEDLAARYKAEGKSDLLLEQEIAVAVADTECARQTGITQVVLDLKKSSASTLSASEQRSLSELSAEWSRAATTAQQIAPV